MIALKMGAAVWALFSLTTILTHAQISNWTVLHSFGFPEMGGIEPRAGLIVGSDGALYGTTARCGLLGLTGTVFRVQADGSGYRVLRHFGGNDGALIEARLLEATDGALYGTASRGGNSNRGTVFRLNKDGRGFSVLHHFANTPDGSVPFSALIEGSDGMLYGTTLAGGTAGQGTVYRLNKNGSGYQIVHEFGVLAGDGRRPMAGLLQDDTGTLYGTVSEGGTAGLGGMYKLNPDGTGYVLLRSFLGEPDEPEVVRSGLLEGPDGILYGASRHGGLENAGTVFNVKKDGTGFTIIRMLSYSEAANPSDDLFLGGDGRLYGTAFSGGSEFVQWGAVFAMDTTGSNFATLHQFTGSPDGRDAASALVLANGYLYGTTSRGGDVWGTIFRIRTNGMDYSRLWNFNSAGPDARPPARGALARDMSGTRLFGSGPGGTTGRGAVFKLNLDGSGYTLLHSVGTATNDGVGEDGVTVGTDGYLYGVSHSSGEHGRGLIFRLQQDGAGYAVLRHFGTAPDDPTFTVAPLIEGTDGGLYGCSPAGGANNLGAIFKINKDGTGFSVLYSFQSSLAEGGGLAMPLTEGPDGMLYGTCSSAGAAGNGTIFRIGKTGGDFAVLRHFGDAPDAGGPWGPLLLAGDGSFYGATTDGGNHGRGTLYRIDTQTNYAIILHFGGTVTGQWPSGALVEGADGKLYGMTRNLAPELRTLFRVNKNGTGHEVLAGWPASDGAEGGLLAGGDGALYGITDTGGDSGLGTIFRFGHVIGISAPGALEVTGIPGYTYSLQRSTNLQTWATLTNFVLTNLPTVYHDSPAPSPAAFYKVRTP